MGLNQEVLARQRLKTSVNLNENPQVMLQHPATKQKLAYVADLLSPFLSVAGQPWSWGWNAHGQLGHGNTINKSTPTEIKGISVRRTHQGFRCNTL